MTRYDGEHLAQVNEVMGSEVERDERAEWKALETHIHAHSSRELMLNDLFASDTATGIILRKDRACKHEWRTADDRTRPRCSDMHEGTI